MLLKPLENIIIFAQKAYCRCVPTFFLKKPIDLTFEETMNILSNSKFPYGFVELMKNACKTNESVARW